MADKEHSSSVLSFQKDVKKQIISGVVVLAFLLSINLFFYSRVKSLSQEIISLKGEILKNQQLFSSYSNLKIQKREAGPIFSVIDRVLPFKEEVLRVAGRVEQKARENKLQQSFSFGQEYKDEAGGISNIGFNLVLNGPLNSFVKYLKDLEQLPPFIQFSFVEVNKKGDDYQFNSTGRIYMR
jgi:Tfp pilus assembly protein PilO